MSGYSKYEALKICIFAYSYEQKEYICIWYDHISLHIVKAYINDLTKAFIFLIMKIMGKNIYANFYIVLVSMGYFSSGIIIW